jgi:bacterioferritin
MAEAKSEGGVAVQIDHSTEIIEGLTKAYHMELETVLNYVANSINPDGIKAKEIKESLQEDIAQELGHAQMLGKRIHVLGGTIPGSMSFNFEQQSLQPKQDSADLISVIRGVIDAEEAACQQYQKLIEMCDGVDFATQDLCIEILRDEEEHRREFQGFLKEYERK